MSRPIRLHNQQQETPLYLCAFSGDIPVEQMARLGASLGKLPGLTEAYLCETNDQPNRPENADPILVLVVNKELEAGISSYTEALVHRLFPEGPQFEIWITSADTDVVTDVKKVSGPLDLFPEGLTWRM
ncbi:hypothetical protein Acid345_4543 [Candidatus Koribacter versatilis Ellin345]|uniref:Uncharacterized protein n=2 Tax=Candidatus Korobacter versatilis TaxID=658062 RepID=Q1IHV7_KORVE|nr:hypothetical protein Acid345_4543 [Candidatus Koribacter versatilis Ellin345]